MVSRSRHTSLRAKLKVAEVHSFEEKRIYGKSNPRAVSDGLRVIKTILKDRLGRSRPAVPADQPDQIASSEYTHALEGLR